MAICVGIAAALAPAMAATNTENMSENAAQACQLSLPAEDWYRIWRAAKGHDVA